MENMRFKVGDRVRIKSLDWYNENKNNKGIIVCGSESFTHPMSYFCNKVVSIITIQDNCYRILEDDGDWYWTDEMIEGLVEEETKNWADTSIPDGPYTVTYDSPAMNDSMSKNNIHNEIILPEGYIFKDEKGNVINTTKIILEKEPDDKLKLESTKKVREYWSEYTRIFIEIYDDEPNECVLTHLYTLEGHRQKGYGRKALIEAESIAKELGCHTTYLKVETDSWMHQWYLRMGYKWYKNANKEYTWLVKNLTSIEKKKKKYPKTYEECCQVLGISDGEFMFDGLSDDEYDLFDKFVILKRCRDAYWKIAGEEMGLGKPWEPDWTNYNEYKFVIGVFENEIIKCYNTLAQYVLAFPTEEMQDAFYENFKGLIEQCKELL